RGFGLHRFDPVPRRALMQKLVISLDRETQPRSPVDHRRNARSAGADIHEPVSGRSPATDRRGDERCFAAEPPISCSGGENFSVLFLEYAAPLVLSGLLAERTRDVSPDTWKRGEHRPAVASDTDPGAGLVMPFDCDLPHLDPETLGDG